jgi:Skp family chaperone for outer membrane proteins
MKRILMLGCGLVVAAFTMNALADDVGVVDMKSIFQNSAKVKEINAKLGKKFASDRAKIVQMQKSFKDNMTKLQRDGSVMSKKDIEKLKVNIRKQQAELQAAQAKFQQQLYAAQNKAMGAFMKKVQDVVKVIARRKGLELVLPKNGVLYSAKSMDITADISKKLN